MMIEPNIGGLVERPERGVKNCNVAPMQDKKNEAFSWKLILSLRKPEGEKAS